jgi:hypothetical protein
MGINQYFVIFSQQRNGSIWVKSLLNSHEAIIVYPEVFQDNRLGETGFYDGSSDINIFIDRLFESHSDKAAGFKLMYDQLKAYPAIGTILKSKSVKMIQLQRNNILDIYISRMVALNNNIWVIHSNDIAIKKVYIDTSKMINDLDDIKIAQDNIEKVSNEFNTIKIIYEDLVDNPLTINKVFSFLGVKELDSINSEQTVKIVKSRKEAVSNFDEVVNVVNNSDYHIYL